jgi:aryl-alcohol dehydrogenase-like predicted oxidoreductase
MATQHPSAAAFRTTALPSGETMPVLGQGTWGIAERPERRASQIASLRMGIDVGMTLIDTAEMYAGGAAEELVAEAIEGRRSEVFLKTCSAGLLGLPYDFRLKRSRSRRLSQQEELLPADQTALRHDARRISAEND